MYLSSHNLLLLTGSISLVAVSGFLCWVLYELARMLRQTNELLEETHKKINRVETFIEEMSERIGSASQYLGILAGAGKELFGWMRERKKDTPEEEDVLEELPKRKRKRS